MSDDLHNDLETGFQIEDPRVLVNWRISESSLTGLFKAGALKHVTEGYYTMSCTSLGGLTHKLGFHFEPRRDGKLAYLEFFRERYGDLKKSFDEFQSHTESAFGAASVRSESTIGLPAFRWTLGDIEIFHYALDRFGPEEHLTIRCDGRVDSYWNDALKR